MALASKPKRDTAAHRKRGGRHHRHNNSYLKHYWPYIPMLAIVGIGIVLSNLWSHGSVLGVSSDFSSAALINATNAQRQAQHEPELVSNPQLDQAAQAKAVDMVSKNYWSHTSPNGGTPWSYIAKTGYSYEVAGENLAYGFHGADEVIAGWMNSPEHKKNLMSLSYQDVGFGVAQSRNFQGKGPATIVVAEYAEPIGGSAPVNSSTLPIKDLTDSTKLVSRIQIITDGQAGWASVVVWAIAGASCALLAIRHGRYFRKLIIDGEHFILNKPLLDIALVLVGTSAVVFMQASGTIR